MSEPISIQLDSTVFTPGSTVTGKVIWATSPSNQTLEIRLFWFTEGRGTQDIEIAAEQSFPTTSQHQGDADFTLTLPDAPLSFSGQLISLKWAVEAVALEDGISHKEDIIVSLTDKEVTLPAIDTTITGKKKKRSKNR